MKIFIKIGVSLFLSLSTLTAGQINLKIKNYVEDLYKHTESNPSFESNKILTLETLVDNASYEKYLKFTVENASVVKTKEVYSKYLEFELENATEGIFYGFYYPMSDDCLALLSKTKLTGKLEGSIEIFCYDKEDDTVLPFTFAESKQLMTTILNMN